MKLVDESTFRYKTEPNLMFFLNCPYCGRVNMVRYWIKFLICRHCGNISAVPEGLMKKMIELENKYGNPSRLY